MPDIKDLIDLGGVAELLEVSVYTPQQWRQRDQLPPPDLQLGNKPMWFRATIQNWAQDTERWPPGRIARAPRAEQLRSKTEVTTS